MDRKKMKKGCLIFTLTLFLLIPLLTARDCLAEPYYPLKEGMVWEYQITRKGLGDIGGGTSIWTRKALAPRKLNDKKVVPLQDQNGYLVFVIEDDIGVGNYARQNISDIEPRTLQPIDYFIKYPLKTVATDQKKSNTILLERAVDVDLTVTIETLSDTVTVPAGTFENCLRIKYWGKKTERIAFPIESTAIIEIEGFDWYAKNVGGIKAIRTEKTNNLQLGWSKQMIIQLMKFTK